MEGEREREGRMHYLFVLEVIIGESLYESDGQHDGLGELSLEVGAVEVVLTLTERVEQPLQLLLRGRERRRNTACTMAGQCTCIVWSEGTRRCRTCM